MKGMRNIAPFGLRMPDELRESVAKRAKANGRSMNSEIVQILEDTLMRDDNSSPSAHSSEVDLFPLSDSDYVTMTKVALNDMLERSMQSAVDQVAKSIGESAVEAVLNSLSEKYNFVPKSNKKPT
ncbi:Arc family DNA-binding protein [Serratia bockelmannii]|uniref:Arc family DNA-binding protein n=1 Tax=Serratia bockelmannii TaxID=2703793 RepID=UPI0011C94BEE|nr:Arc family DNA-binding protein [Serratia bockelmannii]MBN5380655.1 Arc family DNA-binding protein [Serratia marcescens]TXE47896.1 Arc family DNA-binding protein [Serratia bockelmannii]